MLNVLPSASSGHKGVASTSNSSSSGTNEFCDYVSDLGGFGLDGDRGFRYNELYYSNTAGTNSNGVPLDPSSSTSHTQGNVEDYSEYFKGPHYSCFNTEDYGNLGDYPNNTLINHHPLSMPSQLPPMAHGNGSYPPVSQTSGPSPAVLIHIDELMKGISLSMSFTDISLLAGSNTIHAHKSILASHSTFLRQILINHDSHSSESEDPLILLPDVKLIHVQMMISFFYTGEVRLSSREDVHPLRELCIALGVASLTGRLDELSLSLNQTYENNTIMLDSAPDLDPLDLPHLSTNEIDYLNGSEAPVSLSQSQSGEPPTMNSTLISREHTTSSNSIPLTSPPVAHSSNQVEVQGRVKKKAFSCTRCQSKFYTQESLHVHESLHEERKPFTCDVCGKSIATKGHLAVHMRIHSGEKPYTCDQCDKSFMDSSSLKRHKYTHGNRKTLECDVCSKVFGDRSTYRRHYKEKHMEGSKKFVCHICQKLFHRRETLNAHFVKVHSLSPEEIFEKDKAKDIENSKKWKTFKCSVCNMMFSKQSTMEIHLRTHTGDKPYVCEVCGKKFTRSNNLKLHKRVHTGEKPYQCSQCDKRFSDVSAHKRHLRTHTGEKPYECSKCKKGFIQIGAKNVHEKACMPSKTISLSQSPQTSKSQTLISAQSRHTVPGTLYVPQDQQQSSYNPLMDDSSLANMENHSDLHNINIV